MLWGRVGGREAVKRGMRFVVDSIVVVDDVLVVVVMSRMMLLSRVVGMTVVIALCAY